MYNVPAFSALPVLVIFLFIVVSLAAQTPYNNGQTPAAQRLETPASVRQYQLPPAPATYSNGQNGYSSPPPQQPPTMLYSSSELPVNQGYFPPTPPVPFTQSPRPPAPPITHPLPQQDSTYYPYETVSVPKKENEASCPALEGNMDKLSLDQFSSRLTNPCRYDKVTRPDNPVPLPVTLQIDIQHIEAIEQLVKPVKPKSILVKPSLFKAANGYRKLPRLTKSEFQFKMHMLLQYKYVDYRLKYDHISPRRGVMLGEELLRNKIWVPHIVLSNERESGIMGLEGNDLFVALSPQGEVIFSYRMTATIYCWMDLKKFPFDSQVCDLSFRSWTYNASRLILQWDDEEPVKVAHQLHLTEFTLAKYSTFSKLAAASLSRGAFVGNYSLLVFEFLLQREIGYYIMDYFIPSILLVATSWVTFWLQADNAAPRITLGTSTMLAFITLAQGQSKHLPKVSYIKASEIWFLGCTVFIFASMVEFAFVNIIWRRRKKVELKKVNSKYILKSTLTPRLARKELQRSNSMNNLHKSHSCSSLANCTSSNMKNKDASYNNYLTVHSFPSTMNLPTITMQSEDDLINADSQVTIPVPNKCEGHEYEDKPQKWTSMTPQEVAIWIDKRSRLVFPCAFLVFNIFYWAFVYGL